MLARVFAVALLLATPFAMAAPPAAPTDLPMGMPRYVYAEIGLGQPDLATIDLSGRLWIHRHEIGAQVYDADEIGSAYAAGGASAAAVVAGLEEAVRASLEGMILASFPDATITDLTARTDPSTLRAGEGNPFDPAVEVEVSARILRAKQAIGLGTLSDAAIATAFSAGARVRSDLTLVAEPGHRVAYTLHAPASPAGVLFAPGPGVAPDGRTLAVEVDNTLGGGAPRTVTAILVDPRVAPPRAEDIRTQVDVTLGAIPRDATGIPVSVAVDADIRALDVPARFPGALPSGVVLPYVSADGVRALRLQGALDDAAIARANEALLGSIRDGLARAFGGAGAVTGGLDSVDLARGASTPYDAEPPLGFAASSNTTYAIRGASGEDIDLALRIGGAVEMDLALFPAGGQPTTFAIHPPAFATVSAAGAGVVSPDGATATFHVPANASRFPAALTLRGRDAPTFDAQDAQVNITVDLKDLDISLGDAVGGDMGDLYIELTVEGDLRVIEVPEAMRKSLPQGVALDHLASDAIRLLVDRGKIDAGDLAELEGRLLGKVESSLAAALGAAVPVEGGIARSSLDAALVADPVSSEVPVVFTARADVVKPLSGGGMRPQAAIALYSQALPLALPRIEGLDTTYTVILPRGLSVSDLTGQGGEFEVLRAPDGREMFVVRPTEERAEITATMAVTPAFVLVKFWPVVLLAVILLVVLVGSPIALLRMRKKKRAKAK